jgi:hypothetical protein
VSPWYPAGDSRVDLEAAWHQSESTGRTLPRPRPNGAIVWLVWVAMLVFFLAVMVVLFVRVTPR